MKNQLKDLSEGIRAIQQTQNQQMMTTRATCNYDVCPVRPEPRSEDQSVDKITCVLHSIHSQFRKHNHDADVYNYYQEKTQHYATATETEHLVVRAVRSILSGPTMLKTVRDSRTIIRKIRKHNDELHGVSKSTTIESDPNVNVPGIDGTKVKIDKLSPSSGLTKMIFDTVSCIHWCKSVT